MLTGDDLLNAVKKLRSNENAKQAMTTDNAYQIWETFKASLKDEPTDDMKKALGNVIRVISSNIHRSGVLEDEPWLTYIADELNCISYDVEAL